MSLPPYVNELAGVCVLASGIQDPCEGACLGLGVPWGLVPIRLGVREVC